MLYQFDVSGIEWILGVGIMFGLAFVMTTLTFNSMSCFFIWLTIFNAFVVWAGLLPLWTLILCIVILTTVIYFEMSDKKGGNG